MYPTLLEFSIEATYPNDESVVVAFLLIYSSVQGVFLLYAADFLTKDATGEKFRNVNSDALLIGFFKALLAQRFSTYWVATQILLWVAARSF